ncbi:hypothetical protein QVD17_16647 [Tagetes erecta]|uniref:Uncharacterized protein n=1 Tax=Tagetes erecta TaxID=13708 RepID=A0AAD8KRU9_TARER|nr:hypothetical protein QVD17_16647 [Tagetes erecta]
MEKNSLASKVINIDGLPRRGVLRKTNAESTQAMTIETNSKTDQIGLINAAVSKQKESNVADLAKGTDNNMAAPADSDVTGTKSYADQLLANGTISTNAEVNFRYLVNEETKEDCDIVLSKESVEVNDKEETDEDGFTKVVPKKGSKGGKKGGTMVHKQQRPEARPIWRPKEKVVTNIVGESSVIMHNKFEVLNESVKDGTEPSSKDANESDEDDVETVFDETVGFVESGAINTKKGASTPSLGVSNG